jgi:rRNA maturation protein Rpf1
MILLTTSRRPTSRLRTFCRDIARVIPGTMRTNRGKMSLKQLAERAVEEGISRLVVIERWKGGPGRIKLYRIEGGEIVQEPPQVYIQGVRLQRELERGEVTVKSLMIGKPENETSDVIMLAEVFSDFLGIPIMNANEPLSRYKAAIEIRRSKTERISLSFLLIPRMTEIGPRVTISHLVWNVR